MIFSLKSSYARMTLLIATLWMSSKWVYLQECCCSLFKTESFCLTVQLKPQWKNEKSELFWTNVNKSAVNESNQTKKVEEKWDQLDHAALLKLENLFLYKVILDILKAVDGFYNMCLDVSADLGDTWACSPFIILYICEKPEVRYMTYGK